jgi:hypothetical protein
MVARSRPVRTQCYDTFLSISELACQNNYEDGLLFVFIHHCTFRYLLPSIFSCSTSTPHPDFQSVLQIHQQANNLVNEDREDEQKRTFPSPLGDSTV